MKNNRDSLTPLEKIGRHINSRLSLNALSEESGIQRRELKLFLQREGVPVKRDGKRWLFDAAKAREAVKRYKKREAPGVDPETGLTWGQKLAKEKAREIELKNIETERQQSEDWIKIEDVDGAVRLLTDALERFPGKWRSEHGLSERIYSAIQRDIDTARRDAAAKLRK